MTDAKRLYRDLMTTGYKCPMLLHRTSLEDHEPDHRFPKDWHPVIKSVSVLKTKWRWV